MSRIMDQARITFRKLNSNSYLTLDDLVSEGLTTYVRAMREWNENGSKFETYFITSLKGSYFKIVRDSYAKKRGGMGDKTIVKNYGFSEKGEPIQVINNSSIDEIVNDMSIQLASAEDNEVEYGVLLNQVETSLPKHLIPVFKQLTDPDEELLEQARIANLGKRTCSISDSMLAKYLGITTKQLTEYKSELQKHIRKSL